MWKHFSGLHLFNQFTAIMMTHVVIENVMYCAIMTTHVVMIQVCKDFDMSIFKKEQLRNQLRYLDWGKTIKINSFQMVYK